MSSPVGFRFHPSDEELIVYYLKHKLNGRDELVDDIIGEINVYRRNPRHLPDCARMKSDDLVWYFFCRLEHLYGNTALANRKTENGFWKVTGKPRDIKAKESSRMIGTKKTLVFHFKRGDSKPVRTEWVIHEYQPKPHINQRNPIVLCKLMKKSDEVAGTGSEEGEASVQVASFGKNPAALALGTEVPQSIILPDMEFNHTTKLTGDVDVDVDEDVDLAEFKDSFFADPSFVIPSMSSPNMHSGETSTNQDQNWLPRGIAAAYFSDASRHNRIEHESSISEEDECEKQSERVILRVGRACGGRQEERKITAAPPIRNLIIPQVLPRVAQSPHYQLESSLSSLVSRERVAPHIKKEYPCIDRPRGSSSAAVPKEERKITGRAFIRKETIMASHSPTRTSVHLRIVIVGLFLLIIFVFMLLLLH